MKVGIVFDGPLVSRGGGPATYLWNLRFGFEQTLVDPNVTFLFPTPKTHRRTHLTLGQRLAGPFIPLMYGLPSMQSSRFDLVEYEGLHFHTTQDLYRHIRNRQAYSGPVLLTVHTPVSPSAELRDVFPWLPAPVWSRTSQIDHYALDRADVLLWPSPEAMEPLLNWYPAAEKKRFLFAETGVPALTASADTQVLRQRFGTDGKFVVGFVGRHNQAKGYDLLIKAVELLWRRGVDLHVVVAGTESRSVSRPLDARWHEIGWTRTPGDVIAAADVFVLPNRHTFFDLALLEALSMGVPIVATATGGNVTVAKRTAGVLTCLSNPEDLAQKIEMVYADTHRESLGVRNRQVYESHYRTEHFAERYLSALSTLDS